MQASSSSLFAWTHCLILTIRLFSPNPKFINKRIIFTCFISCQQNLLNVNAGPTIRYSHKIDISFNLGRDIHAFVAPVVQWLMVCKLIWSPNIGKRTTLISCVSHVKMDVLSEGTFESKAELKRKHNNTINWPSISEQPKQCNFKIYNLISSCDLCCSPLLQGYCSLKKNNLLYFKFPSVELLQNEIVFLCK